MLFLIFIYTAKLWWFLFLQFFGNQETVKSPINDCLKIRFRTNKTDRLINSQAKHVDDVSSFAIHSMGCNNTIQLNPTDLGVSKYSDNGLLGDCVRVQEMKRSPTHQPNWQNVYQNLNSLRKKCLIEWKIAMKWNKTTFFDTFTSAFRYLWWDEHRKYRRHPAVCEIMSIDGWWRMIDKTWWHCS